MILYQDAFNGRRLADLVNLYDPAAVLALPDALPVTGHAAIEAALARQLAEGMSLAFKQADIVETRHGLALATAGWTRVGPAARICGTCRIVLRRQADGQWQLLIDDPGYGQPA